MQWTSVVTIDWYSTKKHIDDSDGFWTRRLERTWKPNQHGEQRRRFTSDMVNGFWKRHWGYFGHLYACIGVSFQPDPYKILKNQPGTEWASMRLELRSQELTAWITNWFLSKFCQDRSNQSYVTVRSPRWTFRKALVEQCLNSYWTGEHRQYPPSWIFFHTQSSTESSPCVWKTLGWKRSAPDLISSWYKASIRQSPQSHTSKCQSNPSNSSLTWPNAESRPTFENCRLL